jgi:hypothetical protein
VQSQREVALVEIFNLDEAAIFGPGSEWLWTMVTGLVLGLTGFAIFRQLSAQRFGNELSYQKSLNDEWQSPAMKRYRLAALMDIARGKPEVSLAMQQVGDLFEEFAYLQNHGLLETDWGIDLSSTNLQRWWWGMAAPRVARAREQDPRQWREWERVATDMRDRDRKAGTALDLRPEYLNGPALHAYIVRSIEALRLEQEVRSGVIPTWPEEVEPAPTAAG